MDALSMSGCSFESRDSLTEKSSGVTTKSSSFSRCHGEILASTRNPGAGLQPLEASPEVCAVCATVARAVAALPDPEG